MQKAPIRVFFKRAALSDAVRLHATAQLVDGIRCPLRRLQLVLELLPIRRCKSTSQRRRFVDPPKPINAAEDEDAVR